MNINWLKGALALALVQGLLIVAYYVAVMINAWGLLRRWWLEVINEEAGS